MHYNEAIHGDNRSVINKSGYQISAEVLKAEKPSMADGVDAYLAWVRVVEDEGKAFAYKFARFDMNKWLNYVFGQGDNRGGFNHRSV